MYRLLSLILVLATATHAVAVVAAEAATTDVLDVPAARKSIIAAEALGFGALAVLQHTGREPILSDGGA